MLTTASECRRSAKRKRNSPNHVREEDLTSNGLASPSDDLGPDNKAVQVHEVTTKTTDEAPTDEGGENMLGVMTVDGGTGESQYANMAYWGSMLEDVPLFEDVLDKSVRSNTLLQSEPRTDEEVLGEVADFLPSKSEADLCLQQYLRAIQPLIPLFDRTDLIKRYTEFWLTFRYEQKFPTFVSVIFLICYCACLTKSEELNYVEGEPCLRTELTYQAEVERYQTALELSLKLCLFPCRPTTDCLIAAVIHQCCTHRSSSVHNATEVAQLVRVAQLMGLYRDPTRFSKLGLDPPEIKTRRGLWFHLMCMDISGSVCCGLPPTIIDGSHDVEMPDENVGYEQEQMSQILANGKHGALRIQGLQLQYIYGLRKVRPLKFAQLVEEANNYAKEIKVRIAKLRNMTFEKRHPEASLAQLESFRNMACLYMELLCSRTYCMLYHPSLDGWVSKRKDLITAATKVLRLCIEYANLPECKAIIWYFRVVRPHHSLILVMKDIYCHPNEPISEEGFEESGVDGRIRIVEQAIGDYEYMQLHKLSDYAESQWKAVLKVKDLVWASLPAEILAKSTLGNLTPAELRNSARNASSTESDSETTGLRKADAPVPDSSLSLLTGPIEDDDILQRMANLNSWDIDWLSFVFDLPPAGTNQPKI
ncbi:uncharacterized protein V1516DRAFT_629877 [Lipomyces oligophaga]|uniref:uncharacterized protein n=1 Tax=Lipomyces oligophaga TaxID=45792 RepID=UPI0034CD0D32